MKILTGFIAFITFLIPSILYAENVTSFNLDNGMQVVVIEDHRAPVVTHMVWYRVGSADEKAGKSGIAHFLEHLLFKGTETLKPGEFSEIVAANGGQENAFTSYDYTAYFQRVSADRLSLMMGLEADRMQNLILSEEEVLPERDVVVEERNSRTENNPNSLLHEQRNALQFHNHRYGIPVIGWMHEIKQLTRQDALEFYRTYYAPNNAILIVAGDTTPEEVRALATEHYGPLVPSKDLPERVRTQEPPHIAPFRTTLTDARVRQPQFIRTYLAESRKAGDQKEAAALVMLAELLGGSGLTSYLGQELQLKQKVVINSSAFYDGTALDMETFGLYILPAPGTSNEDAEAALDKAIETFLETDVDAAHLERLKTQAMASQIYARDSLSGLAREYGTALTTGLTIQDVQDWPAVLQAVTAEDVMAAARKVLNINNSVSSWLLPETKG
ncbi:insulinase family protein [Amylibacter sp. SFDW26]|uniref:M16 family metallopeptidase n=1 Tax=Amylibacter sp. SFDW26 TaxID=2652722 RepID=UPI001261C809|nr:pitrilysin family protein [Amylibacter sp. SFDW26]KAB7614307.1 insulinase family protein [Amylibacter sp. SFDW26]